MDTPTNEPTVIRAGDSVSWSRELAEYSADDGWALKYRLLYAGEAPVDIASTGAGSLHSVALASTTTAGYAAGAATLVAYVENSGTGARQTLESQAITLLPDLTAATNHDGRSANEIALAQAKAALADYVASGRAHIESYDIAGRSFKFRSTDDIRALIQHYELEVAKERAARALLAGGSPGRVCVRM